MDPDQYGGPATYCEKAVHQTLHAGLLVILFLSHDTRVSLKDARYHMRYSMTKQTKIVCASS